MALFNRRNVTRYHIEDKYLKCGSCFETITNQGLTSLIVFSKCGHSCCRNCFAQFLAESVNVNDSSYNRLVDYNNRQLRCYRCNVDAVIRYDTVRVIFDVDGVHKRLDHALEELATNDKEIQSYSTLQEEKTHLLREIKLCRGRIKLLENRIEEAGKDN